jgi:hypothetical protein
MKYFFFIIFILLISITGYFHFNTPKIINKINEIKNTNFSIEIDKNDKKLNIFILGNLFLDKSIDLNKILPKKFISIFKESDLTILEIKNQIFDNKILKNLKGDYIISDKILNKLHFFNISHVVLNSPTLFSRGSFYYELTIGNIIKSNLELIYPFNISEIQKGNSLIYFITVDKVDYNKNIILQKIQNLSTKGIIFVFLDFNKTNILTPSLDSQLLAKEIIDSGANIIIGTGKNNIQSIECYKNSIIFYSLGTIYKDNKNSALGLEFIINNKKLEIINLHLFNLYKNHFSIFSEIQKIDFFSQKNNFKNFSKESKENIKNNKLLLNENLCIKK